jgi:hypothetical protein
MIVIHVWNQWIVECHTQRQAGTVPLNVITLWSDCHLVYMTI